MRKGQFYSVKIKTTNTIKCKKLNIDVIYSCRPGGISRYNSYVFIKSCKYI